MRNIFFLKPIGEATCNLCGSILGCSRFKFFFKLYLSGVGWGHRIYIKKSSKKTINQPKKKDLKLTCVEAFLAGVYWIFFYIMNSRDKVGLQWTINLKKSTVTIMQAFWHLLILGFLECGPWTFLWHHKERFNEQLFEVIIS